MLRPFPVAEFGVFLCIFNVNATQFVSENYYLLLLLFRIIHSSFCVYVCGCVRRDYTDISFAHSHCLRISHFFVCLFENEEEDKASQPHILSRYTRLYLFCILQRWLRRCRCAGLCSNKTVHTSFVNTARCVAAMARASVRANEFHTQKCIITSHNLMSTEITVLSAISFVASLQNEIM